METKTEQEQVKDQLWGQTLDLLLPSGRKMIIREQNGDDDDILSNSGLQKDLSNQNEFIKGIVIKADTPSGKLSDTDIDNMLLKDKYYIMFASRIHSIGKTVHFEYDWKKDGGKQGYDDDISLYIWDFSTEYPNKGHKDYLESRMEPYTENASSTQYIQTTSGKELSFECMRIRDEKDMLKMKISEITKNKELTQRSLKLKMSNGEYKTIQNFRFFSKKDMIEIHRKVNTIDAPFMPLSEIESPEEGVPAILYPIISSSNFFFPEEI